MVRKIFAGIALAGILTSTYATSMPLNGADIDYSILAPSGIASIHYGDRPATGHYLYDGSRYIAERMFDDIVADDNFYSMGLGGVVQIDLDNPNHFIDEAAFIEVTWDNGGDISHHEAAEIWWGTADNSYVKSALLLNCDASFLSAGYNSSGFDIIAPNLNTNDIMSWNAIIPAGNKYVSMYIVDVTSSAFDATTSYDGFDIGEINYSVPEPATIAFLGMGLLSLFGLSYRRKK